MTEARSNEQKSVPNTLVEEVFIKNKAFQEGIPEFLDSGCKSWTLDSGQWTLDAGLWTQESVRWTLDAGRWTLNPGRSTLDSRRWTPNAKR